MMAALRERRSSGVRLFQAAQTLILLAYLLLVASLVGGLVIAFQSRTDYSGGTSHPHVVLGLVLLIAGTLQAFLLRFVALFAQAWYEAS
jgi:hypothetical protein